MNLCDLRYSQALILLMFLRICTGWHYLYEASSSSYSASSITTSSTMSEVSSTTTMSSISANSSTMSEVSSATTMFSSLVTSSSTSEVSSVAAMIPIFGLVSKTTFSKFSTVNLTQPLTSVNNIVPESRPIHSTNSVMNFTDLPPIQGKDVAPDNKSLGIGLGITLPIIALVLVAIFFYKRRRSLNDENASIGKTNVTKVQSNKKSVTKELVITKEIPKINRSRTRDNIYYNIEMADSAQKNNETSTEEYYNVVIEPKEELKNHSTHQQHGTAETQYATLDIRGNSEHLYTGFNM